MANVFSGKKIVTGITGSIAAFKVAGWVSTMVKEDAQVSVIMTESAQRFITPLTFSALTGERTYASLFDDNLEHAMSHIDLGREAALFLVAPASAQTITRLAHGMANDLLSASILVTRAPVIVCPAMNSQMYLHPATQENISKLKLMGYVVVEPDTGLTACGDEGPGRLPEWEKVQEIIIRHLSNNDLQDEKVLITAGPTRESIDPARFLSNRSSGKMGYALARCAYRRGAEVTLVSGPTTLSCPFGVKRIEVNTARQMYEVVLAECEAATIIVKAAAVSDFRPVEQFAQKIKKEKAELLLHLQHNPDILLEVGKRKKKNQLVIGFAAESENIEEEGRKKLLKKNLDMVAVNDISKETSGFEVDTNKIFLLDRENSVELPLASKMQTADMIWDRIVSVRHQAKPSPPA